ncbi:hypothetical protein [Rhizobium leguminosarum]|uniref:hypothetical protein n=1 Tax=Rhizobium leguminosarum TaxID=384 RepID=UPI0016144ABE|nr:hypothetical protein [Rhizobium leguminosarum]MBB4510621.1 hypothetical protein [Rhizobium leguminosarum]
MNEVAFIGLTGSELIMAELLREASSDQRRETLTRLTEACRLLRDSASPIKLKDIERKIVERYGKGAGPKAQSISNERDRRLGMHHYVMACERERAAATASIPMRKRTTKRYDEVEDAIHKIRDMDVRSAMFDLHDRCLLLEKELLRAKALLKTLTPGADINSLIDGKPAGTPENFTLSEDQHSACRDIVDALSNDERLGRVGLMNDGKRVKRKGGTGDELIAVSAIQVLAQLLSGNSK